MVNLDVLLLILVVLLVVVTGRKGTITQASRSHHVSDEAIVTKAVVVSETVAERSGSYGWDAVAALGAGDPRRNRMLLPTLCKRCRCPIYSNPLQLHKGKPIPVT
jgi:hypothetical protein